MSKFVGKYVEDIKDLTLASLLSGLHSVVLGAPGWGKTDITEAIVSGIWGGSYKMIRIEPSSKPEIVNGAIDVPQYLSNGIFATNPIGSAYDPANQAVIVDEIGRGNQAIYGSLMFLLDRRDTPTPPPVICTSNFMPQSKETEALLDRIALWHWVKPSPLGVRAMVTAQAQTGKLQVNFPLPSAGDISMIRMAQVGPDAINAVATTLENLAAECAAQSIDLHPRRIAAWTKLLVRAGMYFAQDANFKTTPDAAVRLLRFAMPSKSESDYSAWGQVVTSVGDPVAVVIETSLSEVADKVNEVAALTDFSTRMAKNPELTQFVMTQQQNLMAVDGGRKDPRIEEAVKLMMNWIALSVRGEKVQRAV